MRSTNVLLIFALISISAINSFEFTTLAEVQELKGSSYGNSLIETISLSLQENGSINDVQKLLDDLLYKLNKDQEDADRDWESTNKTLTEKIETLTGNIEDLRVKISALEASIQEYNDKITTGQQNLKQFNDDYDKNVKQLAFLDDRRKADNDYYKAAVIEHGDMINAIQAVIAELSKLRGSISGVGKPAQVEEIDAETRDREYAANSAANANADASNAANANANANANAANANAGASNVAALQTSFLQITREEQEALIFAQLATSADQAALEKLIGLLNDIESNVKKSLNDDESNEQAALLAFQKLHDVLVVDNDKLTKLIAEQTANIKDYTEKVAKLSAEREENLKLKESKENELQLTIKERQDKENQYNSDKAERANEKNVIQKLQKIVQERLANMSKFLRDNTGAF